MLFPTPQSNAHTFSSFHVFFPENATIIADDDKPKSSWNNNKDFIFNAFDCTALEKLDDNLSEKTNFARNLRKTFPS